MTASHVALLRAVNVGGSKKIPMSDLRDLASAVGWSNAQTLLQSGSLVFPGARGGATTIERALAAAAKERLGIETDIFVRTAEEWHALATAKHPFAREAKSDPSHLVVVVLKDAPTRAAVAALEAAIVEGGRGRERVAARGRELYVYYPDGIGDSKLTIAVVEKKLATRGTARNWNTVTKLEALLSARGAA